MANPRFAFIESEPDFARFVQHVFPNSQALVHALSQPGEQKSAAIPPMRPPQRYGNSFVVRGTHRNPTIIGRRNRNFAPELPFNISDGMSPQQQNIFQQILASVSTVVPGAGDQPEDIAAHIRDPSRERQNLSEQLTESLGEVRALMMLYSRIHRGRPPTDSGAAFDVEGFITQCDDLATLLKNMCTSEREWKQMWRMMLTTKIQALTNVPTDTCLICTEEVAPKLRLNERCEHSMCPECTLRHYWEQTLGSFQSSAKCPFCREEFNMKEMFAMLKDCQEPPPPAGAAASSSPSPAQSSSSADIDMSSYSDEDRDDGSDDEDL